MKLISNGELLAFKPSRNEFTVDALPLPFDSGFLKSRIATVLEQHEDDDEEDPVFESEYNYGRFSNGVFTFHFEHLKPIPFSTEELLKMLENIPESQDMFFYVNENSPGFGINFVRFDDDGTFIWSAETINGPENALLFTELDPEIITKMTSEEDHESTWKWQSVGCGDIRLSLESATSRFRVTFMYSSVRTQVMSERDSERFLNWCRSKCLHGYIDE